MATKSLKTRVQHKIDTTANWNLATNFVPLKGEVIVYSDDSRTFKIGDGVTTVGNLPFSPIPAKTQGIFYAQVDSTSTSTNFTVTIPELTAPEYYDGLTLLLYNGKVTSASGFTINVNGLGAKPSYSNMALGNPVTPTGPTRDTTIFNINYAMLFTYNSTRVSGGCWICYRGYDANTNTDTIGYQVRTNNSTLKASDKFYRYRLLFTSANGTQWVPANTSTSTNATSARNVNQRPIDPFGEIAWYGNTTAIEANASVTAAQLWQQYYGTYTLIGYSFNNTGAAATMTANRPIYIKCTPQSNGSAIIDANTPYVQALPSTDDGKIYIFLGRAVSATAFEILLNHPVYYYKDGAIRVWTNPQSGGMTNPMTTQGDIIVGGTSGAPTRLAGGASNVNKVLTIWADGEPHWDDIHSSSINTTGINAGQVLTADGSNGASWQSITHPSDIFEATYGTTSYYEILNAASAGKICIVKYGELIYELSYNPLASGVIFTCVNNGVEYKVWVDDTDTWGNRSTNIGTVKKVNNTSPDANGNVTIPALPAVTSADAGKILMVDSNGNWVAATMAQWTGGNY